MSRTFKKLFTWMLASRSNYSRKMLRRRVSQIRECEKRSKEARQNYADAGIFGQATVFKEDPTEWLDSNQCKDCFLPAFNLRPKGTAQYILALRNFDPQDSIDRFKFGFIGSSDTHAARPGNGYKDINRLDFTDAAGPTASTGFFLVLMKERVFMGNQHLKTILQILSHWAY